LVGVTAVLKEKGKVLRITKVAEDSSTVTMKLEGKLASDWVPLLEGECLTCLEKRKVLLDFSEVTFVDGPGVELLSKFAGKGIKVVDCCELIKELLEGGGKR
jgi:anti-anti-sigma regulatory factor